MSGLDILTEPDTMVTMTTTMYKMPCLSCGRLLEVSDDPIACECGVEYTQEVLAKHMRPGYYREWLAALACTCGRVERSGDSITVTAHRCNAGGIGMLDRSN